MADDHPVVRDGLTGRNTSLALPDAWKYDDASIRTSAAVEASRVILPAS